MYLEKIDALYKKGTPGQDSFVLQDIIGIIDHQSKRVAAMSELHLFQKLYENDFLHTPEQILEFRESENLLLDKIQEAVNNQNDIIDDLNEKIKQIDPSLVITDEEKRDFATRITYEYGQLSDVLVSLEKNQAKDNLRNAKEFDKHNYTSRTAHLIAHQLEQVDEIVKDTLLKDADITPVSAVVRSNIGNRIDSEDKRFEPVKARFDCVNKKGVISKVEVPALHDTEKDVFIISKRDYRKMLKEHGDPICKVTDELEYIGGPESVFSANPKYGILSEIGATLQMCPDSEEACRKIDEAIEQGVSPKRILKDLEQQINISKGRGLIDNANRWQQRKDHVVNNHFADSPRFDSAAPKNAGDVSDVARW